MLEACGDERNSDLVLERVVIAQTEDNISAFPGLRE